MITKSYPTIDMKKTGIMLREFARTGTYTYQELADYLGLSSTRVIYRWYRGECLPSVDNFYALSRLYEVTINDLIVGK